MFDCGEMPRFSTEELGMIWGEGGLLQAWELWGDGKREHQAHECMWVKEQELRENKA